MTSLPARWLSCVQVIGGRALDVPWAKVVEEFHAAIVRRSQRDTSVSRLLVTYTRTLSLHPSQTLPLAPP